MSTRLKTITLMVAALFVMQTPSHAQTVAVGAPTTNTTTGQLTCNTTAIQVAPNRPKGRSELDISVSAGTSVLLGGPNVTLANGFSLFASSTQGTDIEIKGSGPVYCISPTGVVITFMEVY